MWVSSLASFFAVVYGVDAVHILATADKPALGARVAYTALHRLAWGFALGWLIFASFHGYGGIVIYD